MIIYYSHVNFLYEMMRVNPDMKRFMAPFTGHPSLYEMTIPIPPGFVT